MRKKYLLLIVLVLGWQILRDFTGASQCTNCCVLDGTPTIASESSIDFAQGYDGGQFAIPADAWGPAVFGERSDVR